MTVRRATRAAKARLSLLTAIAAIALVGPDADAHAASAPTDAVRIVHPTGEYPADHENVQAAIDLGGNVLLRASDTSGIPTAFDFGPAVSGVGGRVYLTTDVVVRGETVGSATTTISGGAVPFFGNERVTSRIEGLTFEGPLLSAIIITASSGTHIVGNRVAGVVGSELPSVTGVTDLTEGRGIKLLGNGDPDGAITGTVRIADNEIDDLHADLSDAIVLDAVAADVEITGNRIGTTQSSGIFVIEQKGATTMAGNVIAPGAGDPGELSFGNGITVAGSRGAVFEIERNEITCTNPAADGIHLVGGGSFGEIEGANLADNDIAMTGSAFAAIALEDDVSDSTIARNTITGTANHAVELRQVRDSSTADSNDVRANDIDALDAVAGDIFLDRHSRSTRLAGRRGTVSDLGEGNHLAGFERIPTAPAQETFVDTVVVPAPGPGIRVENLTTATAELTIDAFGSGGDDTGVDNARIDVLAVPTAGDVDLFVQRRRADGSWLTVGTGAAFDLEREHVALRRQPGGRYRVLVHSFAGGPQVVEVTVRFFNQEGVPGPP